MRALDRWFAPWKRAAGGAADGRIQSKRCGKLRRRGAFRVESLEARQLLAANPIITEFMADNQNSLEDAAVPPANSDWIEIQNAGDAAIDLVGWHLTDDAGDLAKWTFPNEVLPPGGFLIVFASGNDAPDGAGNLHTNFGLSAGGEYLALVRPDMTVASEFGPGGTDYPAQFTDISFGIGVSETVTPLVTGSATVSYLTPTASGQLPANWNTVGGDETGFASGTNGIGYNLETPPPSTPGFFARLIDVSSQVATTTTAEQVVANPAAFGVQADASAIVAQIDFAGGGGTFGVNNPYPNGVANETMDDFVVHATADVTIPAGTWQIAFGSDDGARLILDGANFLSRFGENGTQNSADEIRYEAPRGHAWTGGTFTTNAPLSSSLDAIMYERGGGDTFEIAIRNAAGGSSASVGAADGWQLLGDGALGWTVSTDESLPPTTLIQPGGAGAIGSQTMPGNLNLASGGALYVDLDGNANTADKLTVSGTLTLGGSSRLEVAVIAGSLQAGDTFDILDATATSGTFNRIALPLPAVGLKWDTSLLHTTGVISVVVDPNPDDDPLPGNSTRQQIEDYTNLIQTDVEAAMFAGSSSAFVRIPFSVADLSAIDSLRLRVKYDDGFVAYINGQEIARTNAPTTLSFDSTATAERTKTQALQFAEIPLSFDVSQLNVGAGPLNVLAIAGLNLDPLDNDFLLLAELAGTSIETSAHRYFQPATPGAVNNSGAQDVIVPLAVSHERGFYDAPFNLVLSTPTAETSIRYTTDGTLPTATTGLLYTNPLPISATTTLRAAAFRDGYLPTPIETHTYLFVDDIAQQTAASTLAAGFPSTWGGTGADYGLDPDVVGPGDLYGGTYAATIRDDLKALGTLSIVMRTDDMFASSGIYSNPDARGSAWERPTSLEYIPADGSEGFQIDAGIRIQGGAFRSHGLTLKKSFRLAFRDSYGASKLRFPLFGDDATDKFDAIVLRANSNDAWNFWGGTNVQYMRDQWGRSTQLAMGQPSAHGNYMHLYINGQYWGLYNPTERPNQAFSATYFGGDKEDWDAINSGSAVNGSTAAWNTMVSLAGAVNTTNVAASDAAYQQLIGNNADGSDSSTREDYLDVDNMIDYMIVNLYGGNSDWPHKNYWVGRERGPQSTGFKFYMWDSEWSLGMQSDVNSNQVGVGNGVAQPYGLLRANAEFRLQFADRLQKHFFNGGALYVDPANPTYDPAHPERNVPAARYAELAAAIEQAIVGESARWGDMASNPPRTWATWDAQRDSLMTSYFPQRSQIVLNQFRSAGLYPATGAPQFAVGGLPQHGGAFPVGAQLSVSNPNAGGQGTVFITFDGSDPRGYDWTTHQASPSASAVALAAGNTIGLVDTVTVMARIRRDIGGGQFEWSALTETTFAPVLSDLRITEVHYHPADPTPQELAVDPTFTASDFEFVEIRNVGASTINLSGATLSDGVTFAFAGSSVASLAPGERAVVVSNQAAFDLRYADDLSGIQVAGTFGGNLNNGGETIVLSGAFGETLVEFSFGDGWYSHTDGEGYSLTVIDDANLLADLNASSSWRPSQRVHGSPGSGDIAPTPDSIVINEVQTNTNGADRIELKNVSSAAIDVGNWFVSNSAEDRRKYQIAAGTVIPAGGYLVLTEASHFGATSSDAGALVPFALREHGDAVLLTASDASGELFGYREQQSFAASLGGEAIGLYTKSSGGTDFVRLVSPSFGSANGAPVVGPLVINELMYHPAVGEPEFIEIRNVSAAAVALDDGAGNAWRLRGAIEFAFPLGQSIPAGGYAVVVQGADGGDAVAAAAMFRAARGVPAGVPIFVYTDALYGSLNNGGEKLFLDMPGAADSGLSEQPYVLIDAVRYEPVAPWPTEADGGGSSLSRNDSAAYGNDVANWLAGTVGGTPGSENVGIDTTPPTTPANLSARLVGTNRVLLAWNRAADPQTGVDYYNVYRNGALVASTPLPVMTDDGVNPGTTLTYQISAVNRDGLESARSTTVVIGAQTVSYQDGASPTTAYSGTRDTELRAGQPTQNNGADTNLEIDGDDGGFDLAVLLRWQVNPADIPAGSVIVGASISLDVTNESSGPYEISRVLRDWDEYQATWEEFRTGQTWATAGGNGAADRGAVLATITGASVGRRTYAFNATGIDLVQQWLGGTAANYGVVIANATTTNGMDVSSREVAAAANRPMFNISFVPAPTPGVYGDVNVSGGVDAADIDFLYEAIAVGSADPHFDLNGDSVVDRGDVDHLVHTIFGTQYGDANLDGLVDRSDAAALSQNFGKAALWSTGDFDGDRLATLADLAMLQSSMSPPLSPVASSPAAAVVRVASRLNAPTTTVETDSPQLAARRVPRIRPLALPAASTLATRSGRRSAGESPAARSSAIADSTDAARPTRRRLATHARSADAVDAALAAGFDH
ncbi:MAG: lamin tail domain-containing protein [Pirellulales bacterium]